MLSKTFGPKREKVTEGLRKLQNEESHDLYSSRSIIQMNKLKMIRWTGQVACRGEKKTVCKVLEGKPKGKTSHGNASTDDRITSTYILQM